MFRKCLNQKKGLEHRPKECRYLFSPHVCKSCNEVRNVVAGIAPLSRLKILKIRKEG